MENKQRKRSILSISDFVFFFAGAGLISYYFVRVIFLFNAQYSFFLFIFSFVVFLAETFLIIQTVGFLVQIFRLGDLKHDLQFTQNKVLSWPEVAVVTPVKNEPDDILEQTVLTLKGLDYEKKNIYLIDDSDDQNFIKRNIELAKKHNIKYFRPEDLKGAKAGALNSFLSQMKEKYLAIFDADQNPLPIFLKETVSVAESDEKIAFVQTPQFYSNLGTSPITRAAAMQQAIFFESICEAKGSFNAMFCCGTNVLIKKDALVEVGGFDEKSITEDFSTSLRMHILGYKSVYYNRILAFGMGPENLPAYFRQQSRWAVGTVQVFVMAIKYFLRKPKSLTAIQWWEYFLSSTFYFTSWMFSLLLLCPILYLFFGISAYHIDISIYFLAFIPYYFFTTVMLYVTLKKINYSFLDIYHGAMMGIISFPIIMVSTAKGLFSRKNNFKVTQKNEVTNASFVSLWPWHSLIILNFFAIIYGTINSEGRQLAVLINVLWCSYHIFLLSYIYYFNAKPKQAINILEST